MATEYGKLLRKIRIENGEILGDMAERLNISIAYLSSIETGARNVPADLTEKIAKEYCLSESNVENLQKAEALNLKEIKLTFEAQTAITRKETALIFARTFKNIDEDDVERIRLILSKKEGKNDV